MLTCSMRKIYKTGFAVAMFLQLRHFWSGLQKWHGAGHRCISRQAQFLWWNGMAKALHGGSMSGWLYHIQHSYACRGTLIFLHFFYCLFRYLYIPLQFVICTSLVQDFQRPQYMFYIYNTLFMVDEGFHWRWSLFCCLTPSHCQTMWSIKSPWSPTCYQSIESWAYSLFIK